MLQEKIISLNFFAIDEKIKRSTYVIIFSYFFVSLIYFLERADKITTTVETNTHFYRVNNSNISKFAYALLVFAFHRALL